MECFCFAVGILIRARLAACLLEVSGFRLVRLGLRLINSSGSARSGPAQRFQSSPRAVFTPRRAKAAAIWRNDTAPRCCSSRMSRPLKIQKPLNGLNDWARTSNRICCAKRGNTPAVAENGSYVTYDPTAGPIPRCLVISSPRNGKILT